MTDRDPFRDSPAEREPEKSRSERQYLILPGSADEDFNREYGSMASKNALEDFLGGSPLNVAVRLIFISLVVGALLMWLELRPMDILRGVQAFFDRIYALGFGAVKEVMSYVLAGAVFVVPAWLVLRLLNVGGRR
jgi:hypothetical protein